MPLDLEMGDEMIRHGLVPRYSEYDKAILKVCDERGWDRPAKLMMHVVLVPA
jgi:hypothetical protein